MKKALFIVFLLILGIQTQIFSADCTNKPEWNASTIYDVEGMEVVYQGKLYSSQHWTQNQVPSANYGVGKPWNLIGICDAAVPNYESPTMTPSNGSTMSSGSATFSWTEVAGATGYQIMVGSVANGNDYFPGSSNADNGGDGNLTKSYMVGSLPVDGSNFYVTLTVWHPDGVIKENYTYTSYLQNSAPTISFTPAPGLINENMASGQIVGMFTISDVDNDNVTFELVNNNPDNNSFELSGNNLQTTVSFDYETKSSYTVTAIATDEHGEASDEFSHMVNVADVDPEYNYPELTGKDEDMKVEGRTKYTNVADGINDSTIIDGGTITATKLIVDELDYATQTGTIDAITTNNLNVTGPANIVGQTSITGNVSVSGTANIAGPLNVAGSTNTNNIAGQTNIAGNLTVNGNVTSKKMNLDTLNMGNGLISFERQNGSILQTYEGKVGSIKLQYNGPTGAVDKTEIYSGNASFYKTSKGVTDIDGGYVKTDSLDLDDQLLLTTDRNLWETNYSPTNAQFLNNPSTYVKKGKIIVGSALPNPSGMGFDLQATTIDGENITTGTITASSLNIEGEQTSGGDLTVKGKLDVYGNVVAGDVISLAENTEANETNSPTFGASQKFLHMGLVEGDATIGWGLHLNSFSFSGDWGHNKIYYHGGKHVFMSRDGVGVGEDYELMELDSEGDLTLQGDIKIGGHLLTGTDGSYLAVRENLGYLNANRPDVNRLLAYEGIIAGNAQYDDQGLNDPLQGKLTHGLHINTLSWKDQNGNPYKDDIKYHAGKHRFLTENNGVEELAMIVSNDGKVGIGTDSPESKLHVDGVIQAKSVKIGDWILETPDYVFQPDYKLRSLEEVEKHIKEKSHLPEVPSAADMKRDGVDLAEMNMILLKKVEELTLYSIEQNKKIEELTKKVESITK